MTLEDKNQNDIINSELVNSYNIEYVYTDKPINRFKTKPILEDKPKLLDNLRGEIENIDNCELKSNSTRLVFSDGNYQSQIMIVGEGPGQKEDKTGKPFVGDAGMLLNKMLKAINIEDLNNQVQLEALAISRKLAKTNIFSFHSSKKSFLETLSPLLFLYVKSSSLLWKLF